MRLLLVSCALLVLNACERKSTLQQMPDADLAALYDQCLDNEPTAPGKVTACENLRKECERRRKQEASFACRSY